MNRQDKEILKLNWELQKERLKDAEYKSTIDISSSCYVEFGTCGITVVKYKKNKWYQKTVNYWKELSFEQFLGKFNKLEWELV